MDDANKRRRTSEKFNRESIAHRSRGALTQFLHELRTRLGREPEFLNRVNGLLAPNRPDRQQLAEWLRLQIESYGEEVTVEQDRISLDLNRLIQEAEPSHAPPFRKEFLTRLYERLRSGEELDADFVRRMVWSGLGVAFMRYSDALRLSSYHVLEADLLPARTRQSIMASSLVPDWSGTIGWISRKAYLRLRRRDFDYLFSGLAPTILWSCFFDPKGRVAMEDIVLGNRSFIAIPVVDSTNNDCSAGQDLTRIPRILGIVFCFFPVDGFFKDADGQQDRLNETVGTLFQSAWQIYESKLIVALQLEAVDSLYALSQRSSLAAVERFYSRGDSQGTTDQDRRREWLQQTLFGATDPSDPLGFQFVVDLEQDLGKVDEPLKTSFLFREATFVREVLDRYQLSCRYPTRWAPNCVWELKSIHDCLHGSASRLTIPPIWRIGAPEDDTQSHKDVFADQFYPPDTAPKRALLRDQVKLKSKDVDAARKRSVDRIKAICTECGWVDPFKSTPDDQNPEDGCDPFRLHEIVRTLAAPDHLADLLLPLAYRGYCTGFIEIKCWSSVPINTRLEADALAPFHSLYSLFHRNFARLRIHLTKLLRQFEFAVDRVETNLPRLKTWLDIRLSLCDAVAKAICRTLSLQADDDDQVRTDNLDQLKLVRKAAEMEASAAKFDTNRSDASECGDLSPSTSEQLAKRIGNFVDHFERFMRDAKRFRIPEVVFVAVWLSRERPTIIGAGVEPAREIRHATTERAEEWVARTMGSLNELLVDDPASMQLLRLFLRWCRQRGKGDLEYVRNPDGGYVARDLNGPANNNAGLPPGFECPPFYVYIDRPSPPKPPKLDECGRVLFQTRVVRLLSGPTEVISQTTFWHTLHDSDALRINWWWDRSPMPAALDYGPSAVQKALFGEDQPSERHQIRFTETAQQVIRALQNSNKEERDWITREKLPQILLEDALEARALKAGRGLQDIISRLSHVLRFLPNREHFYGGCRLASVIIDNIQYTILAHGHSPEQEQIRRLRDDAVTGALGAISILMQTSAIKLARDYGRQTRFLAHQLRNDFVKTDLLLRTLKRSIRRGERDESLQKVEAFEKQLDEFRCLLSCVTATYDDVPEFRLSVVELLNTVIDWRNAIAPRTIDRSAIDTSIPDCLMTFSPDIMRDLFLIFNNLVNNAIDADSSAGVIRIGASITHESGDDSRLVVTIKNDSEKELPSEFIKFMTTEGSADLTRLPVKTTGKPHLGLWTVRSLLARHRFGMAIPSCEDGPEGTGKFVVGFTLRLPLSTKEPR